MSELLSGCLVPNHRGKLSGCLVAWLLQDVNVLLVKRTENFNFLLMQPGWRTWLASLLSTVPKAESVRCLVVWLSGCLVTCLVARLQERTEKQNEFNKFVMNMYAMILFHEFSKGADFDKVFTALSGGLVVLLFVWSCGRLVCRL